jgi:hypothetical protein
MKKVYLMAVVVVGLIAVSSWANTNTWPVVKFSGTITDQDGLRTRVTVPTNGLEVFLVEQTAGHLVALVEISGTHTNILMEGPASVPQKPHSLVGITQGTFTPNGGTTFSCFLEWVAKGSGSTNSNGTPTTLNVKLSGIGPTNSLFTGILLAKTPR